MPSTTDYGDFVAGKLAARLATSATSGATVTAQSVNGSVITWPTGAHRLKLVRKTRTGTEVETVGVASASQSGSTVTLGTLTRQLSLTDGSTFSSGGSGYTFPANTNVYLTWDVFDAERTMKDDKVNTITGAGAIRSTSTTVPVLRLNNVTTAQRTAMTPANGDMVYDTDLGVNYQYVGGAWVAVGDSGTANASTTEAGKVEEATTAELGAGTAAGGTGARLFINPSSTVKTSSGAGDENKLAVLGSTGKFATGFIPGAAGESLIFGDASDGNVTLAMDTTVTRDMYYDTLNLSTFTLNTGGFKVYARTITGTGKIKAPSGGNAGAGGNASGATAGSAGTAGAAAGGSGTIPASNAGKAGGAGGNGRSGTTGGGTVGSAGTNGDAATNALNSSNGSAGSAGGAGGDTTAGTGNGPAGGAAGTGGTTTQASRYTIDDYKRFISNIGTSWTVIKGTACGGSGGGGGGGSILGSGNGGGGGGGGGSGGEGGLWFVAVETLTGSWTIESLGGNGGAGGNGGVAVGNIVSGGGGGGSGGAGGAGGSGILVRKTYSGWSGSTVLTGGAAGAGGTGTVGDGTNHGDGANGSNGAAGPAGNAITINII